MSAGAIALKQEGDLSGVIDTRFGLHVLKLLNRLRLDHRREEEATLDYVAGLKKKASRSGQHNKK